MDYQLKTVWSDGYVDIFTEHRRIFFVLGLLISYVLYTLFVHPLRHIPGPFLARILPGWLAYHSFRHRTESAILNAHRDFGDVVRVGPQTVFVGHPEALRKILGYGENYLDKSRDYDALVIHRPSIFSEVDKAEHAKKRRIAAHVYSMQTVMKLEAVVQTQLKTLLQKFDTYAAKREPVDVCSWFTFYAFDVIGDLAFGRSFGALDRGSAEGFVSHISRGVDYTFMLFNLPSFVRPVAKLLVQLPVPFFTELRKSFAYVREQTKKAVSERWEKRSSGTPQRADILGALMEAKDPETGRQLDFAELATNASTNVVAGSETVTISLTAILYHLLRHPEKVAKLVAEVGAIDGPSNLSYRDIAKMPYLEACVKEGMRLTSPFSGPLPRLSPRGGISINGTYIPEGTVLLVMYCQMHMDERIFPEPAKFSPERWLGAQGTELDRFFLGFGMGPRSCIGKNIALLEMKVLLCALFRRYRLSLKDPKADLVCERFVVTKTTHPVWVEVEMATASHS